MPTPTRILIFSFLSLALLSLLVMLASSLLPAEAFVSSQGLRFPVTLTVGFDDQDNGYQKMYDETYYATLPYPVLALLLLASAGATFGISQRWRTRRTSTGFPVSEMPPPTRGAR